MKLAIRGTADPASLLVARAMELGLKNLGTELGEPPLVCPMNGTSLVRPGRNRTAKGTGNHLQFLYKPVYKAVRIALRFELPLPSV